MKTEIKIKDQVIKTFLPLFPGFYNTIFEPCEDNEMEYINEERETKGLEPAKWEDFKFDYADYRNEIAKGCCQFIENKLTELDLKCRIEFEEVKSPREYNFTTDVINCTITINTNEVIQYMIDHKEELRQYFIDKFTTRDGFISFYNPSIEMWIANAYVDGFSDPVILGSMLDAILENENKDNELELEMYERVSTNVILQVSNYNELLPE